MDHTEDETTIPVTTPFGSLWGDLSVVVHDLLILLRSTCVDQHAIGDFVANSLRIGKAA